MPYPQTIRRLKQWRYAPKAIVIHSTNCRCSFPTLDTDTDKFQTDQIYIANVALDKELDAIFHFIIEKIKDDYYVVAGRPLYSPYDGFNIDGGIFDNAIHVCIIGDYNVIKPDTRLYQILCHRVLVPLTYLFGIAKDYIVLHSEVDKNAKNCPGSFFDKNVLMNHYMTLRRR